MEIAKDIVASWQSVVDVMAGLLDVPAGLIMRIDREDIEVCVASRGDRNPYQPGDREHLHGSGLYCERVIKTRDRLHVPDALRDPEWSRNPDIKLNMVSYLGFPILHPTGEVFGTLCVLDTTGRTHTVLHEELMLKFCATIERDLSLLYTNRMLTERNRELEAALAEIKTLRGIIPICMYCKQIRDDDGYWRAVEEYITGHTEALFSHSICPPCQEQHFPELIGCD
jgi:GAF domain-containing protein